MNPFKKFRDFFIGGALARTDDVFEQVKAEVLFNFTWFFFLTNIPYLFVAYGKPLHLGMGISVLIALAIVLVILRESSNVKMATYFFLFNFVVQDLGHYILNNGLLEAQGSLFALLFILCGYLLLDRRWGLCIAIAMTGMQVIGIYNINSNRSLWEVPSELNDPSETGNLRYFSLIPMLLNIYLVSQFVKARQKAEKQLAERKRMIEEKQKEILDSIHYAKRIQKSLMPNEGHIGKILGRLQK